MAIAQDTMIAHAQETSGWSRRSLDVSRWAALAAIPSIPFATALASVSIGVFLLALLASGRAHVVIRDAFRQPLGRAIVLFFVVVALGMLHGPATWHERWDSLWSWRKLFYAFLLLGLFGSAVWKDRFVRTFAVAAAVGVVASFIAWFGWIPSRPNNEIGVLFQNHTTQGIFFAAGILFCARLAVQGRGLTRFVFGASVVLLTLNVLFVSPGRSAYFVIAAIPLVLGARRFGLRRIPLLVVVVLLLSGAVYKFVPLVHDRVHLAVTQALNADRSEILTSVGFRAVVYRNTLELIAANPVLGYGTGSFHAVYTAHVSRRYDDWRGQGTSDPHDQYMLIAMETGVFGLVAFGAIVVTAFRCARRDSVHAWLGVAALLGWLLTSLVNSHFRTFPEGHLIALILGAMLAAPRDASTDRSAPGRP
ncbi:MAG: hypothetical protein GC151_05995 [Betaproteobacteria bacterium]|nr:hypothetical protein [Betaproteobacteria bacterium]